MQINLNSDRDKHQQQSASAEDKRTALEKALAAREQFLEQHPHLREYQAEIDSILDKSGNQQGRMAVLGTLMQARLLEMQQELLKMTRVLRESVQA